MHHRLLINDFQRYFNVVVFLLCKLIEIQLFSKALFSAFCDKVDEMSVILYDTFKSFIYLLR